MSILRLFRKKPDSIIINDEIGTFILKNPLEDKTYDGDIKWLGKEVSVSLYCDSGGSLTADIALENLHRIAAEPDAWDKKLRQCAVEYIAGEDGTVEIWGNAEDSGDTLPSITTEEFLNRISLGFMFVYPNGEVYFDYDLDEMFTDHGLGISANISGEILSVGLVG